MFRILPHTDGCLLRSGSVGRQELTKGTHTSFKKSAGIVDDKCGKRTKIPIPENENGFYFPRSPNNEYGKTGYIGRRLCQALKVSEGTPPLKFLPPSRPPLYSRKSYLSETIDILSNNRH